VVWSDTVYSACVVVWSDTVYSACVGGWGDTVCRAGVGGGGEWAEHVTRLTADEKLMQCCSLENLMDIYTGGKLS
jgi:hypothetical protein